MDSQCYERTLMDDIQDQESYKQPSHHDGSYTGASTTSAGEFVHHVASYVGCR
jgi:hypothetical protein